MNKVMCGGISPEGEVILTSYLNHFVPEYTIEPIMSAGIRGKMKNHATKPDCILVILDETLYQTCSTSCADVLALPKVHKYTGDEGLKEFLVSMFGELSGDVNTEGAGSHGIVHTVVDDEDTMVLSESDVTEDKDAIINQLKEQLAQAELAVKNLKERSDEDSEEISSLCAEIRRLKSQPTLSDNSAEVDALNNEVSNLRGSLEKMSEDKASLEQEKSELVDIKTDLEKKLSDCVSARDEAIKSRDNTLQELDLLRSQFDTLQNNQNSDDIGALNADIMNLTQENAELKNNIESVRNELNTVVADYDAKVSSLQEELSKVNELCEEYKQRAENTSELDAVVEERNNLTKEVEELKQGMATLSEEKDLLAKEVDDLKLKSEDTTALDSLTEERDMLAKEVEEFKTTNISIADELSKANERILELEGVVTDKEQLLESVSNSANSSMEEVSTLRSQLAKMTVEVDRLQNELSSSSGSLQSIQSSVANKDAEISAYIEKVSQLESDLQSARASLEAQSSSTSVIDDLRTRYSELEMDLAEKDAVLNGVFGQMYNMAVPKAAYGFNLPKLIQPNGKFYCIASGSSESVNTLYALLKRTCMMDTGKRYIIVDLVSDTSIDSSFGATNIKSPIPWLSGEEPFTSFFSDTKMPNVKVITTALSYLNELYLLNVDWSSRLAELSGYADVVIINIGNINGVVQKILYTQFSSVMQSMFVVKATPLNLRTLILGLTGLNVPKTAKVICTDYDTNASKVMYKKLTSKYTAQILKDNEILKL